MAELSPETCRKKYKPTRPRLRWNSSQRNTVRFAVTEKNSRLTEAHVSPAAGLDTVSSDSTDFAILAVEC